MGRQLHVCYTLVADGWNRYAHMAWLSAKGLRLVNPEARVTLLVDDRTRDALRRAGDPLAGLVDETIAVATDIPEAVVRSRYLRLVARGLLRGDFLYLDADTVPIRPFADVMTIDAPLAAALDFNDEASGRWEPDPETRSVFADLGWAVPRRCYNAGIVFLRDQPEVHRLCEDWMRRWNLTRGRGKRTDDLGDQFAFNSAVLESGLPIARLPDRFNAMVNVHPWVVRGASVLHFFASPEQIRGTLLAHLLGHLEQTGEFDEAAVRTCREQGHPWAPDCEPWQLWRSRNYARALRKKLPRAVGASCRGVLRLLGAGLRARGVTGPVPDAVQIPLRL
jgi:hypothetical protein